MAILVFVEREGSALSAASLSTITAAQQLGGDVHLLLAGQDLGEVSAAAAQVDGVAEVLVADHTAYQQSLAESLAPLLAKTGANYSHILAPASSVGKDVLPRAAALLGVDQISDVIEVVDEATFKHPIYAGNAIETVRSSAPLKLLTVRATAFDVAASGQGSATVTALQESADNDVSEFVEDQLAVSDRPELTTAKIVVSGGRALGSKENFDIIYSLADKLGAAVGASRAAVDAGFVPNDLQVGQTGKVVAPDLYIAIGISGAIQHLAGMKGSKVIVAINKDEDAPIFQVADYGLVGDLFDVVPALEQAL
ncbi:electron transfer flavoprotein subunit alpha/FixB family protein [Carnimonas bestiolae]|uniref:electron transfer flavoprotein subunit alpha/FixB family protein n=1 Tax=Carnimonas bestiolae TaxID=3402172 RepID=UPI003EDC41B9